VVDRDPLEALQVLLICNGYCAMGLSYENLEKHLSQPLCDEGPEPEYPGNERKPTQVVLGIYAKATSQQMLCELLTHLIPEIIHPQTK
jgi:hypothetical protein